MILEELENQKTNIRNPRGYGTGHPHFDKRKTEMLGTIPFSEKEEEEEYVLRKVKVSKAFRNGL